MSRTLAALLTCAALLTGCSSATSTGTDSDPLTILAASSLVEALPLVDPAEVYSYDGSSALVDQLVAGFPADVFISADWQNMQRAQAEGVVAGDPVQISTNRLAVVVPLENPAGVTGFNGSLLGAKLVVCDADVPCGAATTEAANELGVSLQPVSLETKVTDVLAKVVSGEADAGVVYITDAKRAAGSLKSFPIETRAPATTYWAAKVVGTPQQTRADAFIAKLAGNQVLIDLGFGAPA